MEKHAFRDIDEGAWCIFEDELIQKLRPLNSSNAYSFTRAGWRWVDGPAKVSLAPAPIYLPTRVAAAGEPPTGRVLYWHPCGFWDICRRQDLEAGWRYYRLEDLPRFSRLDYCPNRKKEDHA